MKSLAMNKQGFLLAEETLKILIAVICIVFLVYLLVSIYNSHTSDKKIEKAREVLSRIETIVSSLNEGESDRQDISDPKGWHLYTFVEQEKPNSCLNTKCLCICQKAVVKLLNSQAEKCDKEGACLTIPKLAVSPIDFKVEGTNNNVLFIEIKKQNDRIILERV